jgi:predicted small integral membrane protein
MMVLCAAGMVFFYAAQNVANLEAAHAAFIYVLSGVGHEAYPETMFFKTASPTIAWVACAIVILTEFTAGILLLKGAIDMIKNVSGNSETFNTSKKWAEIGAATGVFVWFALFGVIGAAFFQMWQTQVGTGSMNGAFQYFISMAVTLMFINKDD